MGRRMKAPKSLSVNEILRRIKSGEISPKSISPEQRRQCVEELLYEQMPQRDIAGLFGVATKTIQRDLKAIRAANALHPRRDLAAEIAGEHRRVVSAALSKLAAIGRDPQATPRDRIEASKASVEVSQSLIECVVGLGIVQASIGHEGPPVEFELAFLAQVVHREDSVDTALDRDVRALVRQALGAAHPPVIESPAA